MIFVGFIFFHIYIIFIIIRCTFFVNVIEDYRAYSALLLKWNKAVGFFNFLKSDEGQNHRLCPKQK